jgi:hypothetical protein
LREGRSARASSTSISSRQRSSSGSTPDYQRSW